MEREIIKVTYEQLAVTITLSFSTAYQSVIVKQYYQDPEENIQKWNSMTC